MKKALLSYILALSLTLTGCASMLERDYLLLAPYEPLTASGGPDSLRVENYQGLVHAVLYLVTTGEEHGVLSLYNYGSAQQVEDDLTRACLEVSQEDPLGAYAVEYIRHECSLIVSYYEAHIHITYRRTPEQMASIIPVTGTSAVRRELSQALASFSTGVVLRVSYFAGEESDILELVRKAYYAAPITAMGAPEVTVSLYPAQGVQRIAEIGLDYPDSPHVLRLRSQALETLIRDLSVSGRTARDLYEMVAGSLTATQEPGYSSPYHALIEGRADSEGAALAYQLLCGQAGVECTLVQGTLGGEPHFWNIVTTEEGTFRHVDLSAGLFSATDSQLEALGGYQWDREGYPVCRDPAGQEGPEAAEGAENQN